MPPEDQAAKKPAVPKPAFGQPEKTDWKMKILPWVAVAALCAVIVMLYQASPRQRALTCRGGGHSLIGFGSCKED